MLNNSKTLKCIIDVHEIVHLPALWLAAMATEKPQYHQQCEGSSWPMETGVAVAMVKKAIHPLVV